ncbi:hypothetical protein BDW62DRAFT_212727 [Aspergillus aurantiobrunneus]
MKFCPNTLPGLFQEVCRLTCCSALLNSSLVSHVVLPSSPNFHSLVNAHYATSAPLHPACFFQPTSPAEAALGVSILAQADDGSQGCQFAIRGGGHNPGKGAASVEGGVTIDLALMNEIVYKPETSTVSIMGGAQWGEVYKTLKPVGVAVPGGRSDTVGVGGLVMGGGMSYWAPERGLACDNVVSFEIALSNGTITTANRATNADLFKALKGGGNNFGIITNVEFLAFKQGPLWGGIVGHDLSFVPQQINALVNFTSNVVHDRHAMLVTIWQHNGKANASFAASGLQYTRGVENPPIFGEFLAVPQTFSTLRVTDIYDLMMETAPPAGKRAVFLTLTVRNEARVLERLYALHEEAAGVIGERAKSADWDVISFKQPFPVIFQEASRSSGDENVLGLERLDADHLVYLLFLSWESEADDVLFHETGYDLIEKLKAYTKETNTDSDYIYMNYAARDQNPLSGYGEENLQWIAAVAKKYDPLGVFQSQSPGGFKVSAA